MIGLQNAKVGDAIHTDPVLMDGSVIILEVTKVSEKSIELKASFLGVSMGLVDYNRSTEKLIWRDR